MLGVDRETIIEDYVLTDANMVRMRAQLMAGRPKSATQDREYPESYLRAEDATIRGFLASLDDRYGSPTNWLIESGLRESSMESLRKAMLV